jgi:hypothetical protein
VLGIYLMNMRPDFMFEDDGGGAYPADMVLHQLVQREIEEFANLGPLPAGYHECFVMELSKFAIEASAAAMREVPKDAIAQIQKLLTELRSDLRRVIDNAKV